MMLEQYDVVVVGGGPGGCQTARECAENGLSVLLVEKDPDIGIPVRCAEGVGEAGLLEFYEPDPAFVQQRIDSLHLVSPDLTHVDMFLDQPGYVLDRMMFDRRIARDAAVAGATIVTNTLVTGARREDDGVVVTLEDRGDIRAKVVVGADGTESRVGRWMGLRTFCKPHDMETAAQYVVAGVDFDPTRIEMWFGSEFAPGGYFWIFPKGDRVANVGLGITGEESAHHTPFFYLDRMMERYWPDASIVGRTMGGIACSGGVKDIVSDNCVLVGDAAHQANPLTAGGIITAMKAGRMAAGVIADALRSGDYSKTGLAPYQKQWDKDLGKVHKRFYRIKEALFHLEDEPLTSLAHSIVSMPAEKRSLRAAISRAVVDRPKLLLELARVFF
jgi:digeranylgeranylglycerophospholipid reductase